MRRKMAPIGLARLFLGRVSAGVFLQIHSGSLAVGSQDLCKSLPLKPDETLKTTRTFIGMLTKDGPILGPLFPRIENEGICSYQFSLPGEQRRGRTFST